jgi:hypothetical protein
VPADAHASEVVDSTLAEPFAAAAALGSAPHASDDVGSESEVPDFAQWRRAALRFVTWYFEDCAGPRRSEQRSRSERRPKATKPTETPLECLARCNGIDPC